MENAMVDTITGCLVIHGFAGNPGEVSNLCEYLRDHGYYVSCPVLKGHCGNRRDLARSSYSEWIKSAEDELLTMQHKCKNVVLIGFSMGGLVAANLAVKYKVNAMITLNTPIHYWQKKKIFTNVINDFKCGNFDKTKGYIRSSFSIPLPALLNFNSILKKTRPVFTEINCPVFVGQGLQDDTVQHRSAEFIFNNVGSETKILKHYDNSGHLICCGLDKGSLFSDIYDFIKKLNI